MDHVVPNGRRTMKTYKRHGKPPYSYVGMIALSIQLAPDQKLSLAGIQATLQEMFTFFKGDYQGWKDSVRHNLSHSECFYKVQEVINNVIKTKKCDWALDLDKLPEEALRKQESRYAQKYHAETITEHFGLPCLKYVIPGMKLNLQYSFNGGSDEIRTFQRPTPITPKRTFTIEALLEDYRKLPFDSRFKQYSFPQTIFDNQSPEMALSNLRSLCNDVDTKDPSLQNSCELNGSNCERYHAYSELHYTPRPVIPYKTEYPIKVEDVSHEEQHNKPVQSEALDLSKSSTPLEMNANDTSSFKVLHEAFECSFDGFMYKPLEERKNSHDFRSNSARCSTLSSPVMFGIPNIQPSEFDSGTNWWFDGSLSLPSRKRPACAMETDNIHIDESQKYSSTKLFYSDDNACSTTFGSSHPCGSKNSTYDMNGPISKRIRPNLKVYFPHSPIHEHASRTQTHYNVNFPQGRP